MISEFRCSEKRGALPKSEKIVNLRRTGPRLHASPTLATFFLQLEQFLTSRDGVASQFKGLRLLPRHDRNILGPSTPHGDDISRSMGRREQRRCAAGPACVGGLSACMGCWQAITCQRNSGAGHHQSRSHMTPDCFAGKDGQPIQFNVMQSKINWRRGSRVLRPSSPTK